MTIGSNVEIWDALRSSQPFSPFQEMVDENPCCIAVTVHWSWDCDSRSVRIKIPLTLMLFVSMLNLCSASCCFFDPFRSSSLPASSSLEYGTSVHVLSQRCS